MFNRVNWVAGICVTAAICQTLLGCAPSMKREGYIITPSEEEVDCEVILTRQEDFHAEQATVLGTMKVGDAGFSTKCGKAEVFALLKTEACKLGAQIVVLRDIKLPGFKSSCYRVTADFISLGDTTDLQPLQSPGQETTGNLEGRLVDNDGKQVAAQSTPARNIEFSVGMQFGLPQGQFEDVASFGLGGHFRAGYWINDRLAIGASVAENTFLPEDFFSTAYLNSDLEIEWSIFALESDVKYQFFRFGDPPSETPGILALYAIARTGYYRTTFTVTLQEEELLKESEYSAGFAGGIGVWGMGPQTSKSYFKGMSVYAEALYYQIATKPETTNYLLLTFGLGFHFGPKR